MITTVKSTRGGDSKTSQCERGATREALTLQERGIRRVDSSTSWHERGAAGVKRETQ